MSLEAFFGLLGGLLVLAFLANRLFRHTRVPDVFVLMATGVVLGPVLGWVDPSQFEQVTRAFGTLALILILFEGGLELDIRETFRHFPGGFMLGLSTYTLSLGAIAFTVHWSLGLTWGAAVLVGAVLGCTSSTIVLPVVQQMSMREPVKLTLLLESSLGDVLAVLTVGVLLEPRASGVSVFGRFGGGFLSEIVVSVVLALLAGILWSRLLPFLSEQRFWHVLTFACVLLLYAATEAAHGSGLMGVLCFGLVLANYPGVSRMLLTTTLELEAPRAEPHQQTLTFHSELAFLVRTFFFVLLGVVVNVRGLAPYVLPILGILGAVFLARRLGVKISGWAWRGFSAEEREVIFWIMPRGLITAVLAIQVVETHPRAVPHLPALAFAMILATNALLVVGTVRARSAMPPVAPEPAAAPLSASPAPGSEGN